MSSFNTKDSDTFTFRGKTPEEAFEALRNKKLEEVQESFRGKTLEEALEEAAMAVPMLLALTICPAILGTQESIRQSQSKNKREEHRARRCNLVVSCVKQSIRSRDINGKLVVLKDNKLYITTTAETTDDGESIPVGEGYPFSGYFLPYPDTQYEGMVSTISDDPPMLNWIYVDKNTYEVKYGLRVDAQDHLTGPFDCTRQDRRMSLEGWEGFAAVEEFPGVWALYFDREDDGLVTKVPMGTRVLDVELTRREKKERKPEPDPNAAQTLDEKMREHKEQTRREEEERAEFTRQAEQQPTAEVHVPASEEERQAGAGIAIPSLPSDAPQADIDRVDFTRLHIDTNAGQESGEHQPHSAALSPSVITDSLSFWSAARKPEDSSDDSSVTAASSIVDRHDDFAQTADESKISWYKQPYVEEYAGGDRLQDNVDT